MSPLIIIIAVTVLVYFLTERNDEMKEKLMFSPYLIKQHGEYHRLISSIFIHADLTHLGFNMFSLYFLGSVIQAEFVDFYGLEKGLMIFVVLYVLGGLFAELWPYSKHQDNYLYRSLGASGAVSAVIFAAIIWRPDMELMMLFLPIPIPAYIFGPIYLAIEYYGMKRGQSNIGHDAHIGGALFGVLFVLLLNPSKGTLFIQQFF